MACIRIVPMLPSQFVLSKRSKRDSVCEFVTTNSTGDALRLTSLLHPTAAETTAATSKILIEFFMVFAPYAPRMIRGVMKIKSSSCDVEML